MTKPTQPTGTIPTRDANKWDGYNLAGIADSCGFTCDVRTVAADWTRFAEAIRSHFQSTGGDASDPLKPSVALLVKLGSAIIHAQEFHSSDSHLFDLAEFQRLCDDPAVATWLKQMDMLAFLPKKRKS